MSTPASPAGGGRPSGSASAIVAGGVSGYHLLKIDGYSRTKGAPNGDHIQSCPFTAGGYQWHIKYYANGDHIESADYISLYLYFDDTAAQAVKAHFKISLLDQVGEPVSSHTKTSSLHSFGTTQRSWGYTTFIKREVLERSGHLKDDCFTVRCDLTVLKEIRTKKTNAATAFVLVPPSDLHQHLGGLLLSQKGADVTFKVGRQTFSAHRCVLGARSPVFEAELFGRMKESTTTGCIRIVDMEPRVFSALLHYIYTDTVPEMNDQEVVMAQHLLVAADRYDMPRLKLICEDKLCMHIDASTAATTLVLAEQHNCCGLKQACFEFLNSPTNMKAVMATDGFEHFTTSCPPLVKELIAKERCKISFRVQENLRTRLVDKSRLRMVRTKTLAAQERKRNTVLLRPKFNFFSNGFCGLSKRS